MQVETLTKEKYYQWLKGDNAGMIETWETGSIDFDGEIKFVVFKSGRQVNQSLLSEYLVEIPSVREPAVDSDFMSINSSPRPAKPLLRESNPPLQKVKATTTESNPVFSILEKSIKTKMNQTLKITLNLPPRDLIKVVASSFDDGQTSVLDYLVSQIPIEDLQKQIKEQLKQTLFTEKTRKKND